MCVLKRVWQRAWDSWLDEVLQIALLLLILAAFLAVGFGIVYGAAWVLELLFGEKATAIIIALLILGTFSGLVLTAIARGIRGIARAFGDCRPKTKQAWEDNFGC